VTAGEIENNRLVMPKGRYIQSVSEIATKFMPLDSLKIAEIKTFPSLFMNENLKYNAQTDPEQEAFFGLATDLRILSTGELLVKFKSLFKINQQNILTFLAVKACQNSIKHIGR
jgi:hypothetical protein